MHKHVQLLHVFKQYSHTLTTCNRHLVSQTRNNWISAMVFFQKQMSCFCLNFSLKFALFSTQTNDEFSQQLFYIYICGVENIHKLVHHQFIRHKLFGANKHSFRVINIDCLQTMTCKCFTPKQYLTNFKRFNSKYKLYKFVWQHGGRKA